MRGDALLSYSAGLLLLSSAQGLRLPPFDACDTGILQQLDARSEADETTTIPTAATADGPDPGLVATWDVSSPDEEDEELGSDEIEDWD